MVVIVEIAGVVVVIIIEEGTFIQRPIQASGFTGFETVGIIYKVSITGLGMFMFPECINAGTWSKIQI